MSVTFTQHEGGYALFSTEELIPGQKVSVTTLSQKQVDVLVGEILHRTNEGVYASFERIEEEPDPTTPVFTKHGEEWVVRGRDLYVGDVVSVEQKNKLQVEVTITEIIIEKDGVIYARFERINDDQAPYFHRLGDKTWVVRGKNLVEGATVSVQTKTQGKKEVRITEIIGQSETGIMDAFFE